MSNTVTLANPEKAQQKITVLLEQLTQDYQSLQQEIPVINQSFPRNDEELSIIEEIELLTTDLRGYASQIKIQSSINHKTKALDFLKNTPIFEIPSLAELYFSENPALPLTKQYLQKLDYLKFLLIDWLEQHQTAEA
jgi:hypothetical protein